MNISIVIPVYNESKGIRSFHHDLLSPVLDDSYEVIYVDDGSQDTSNHELRRIAKSYTRVRVITLTRNFGKELALTAGIFAATGDAIITLDADGQHPPELIPMFIEKWRQGAQVVIGIREDDSHETIKKKWGSRAFYYIASRLSDMPLVPRATDFRLIDQVVQQEFMKFDERSRITRGLIDWLGFERSYISFSAPERVAGTASYTTPQLFRLAFHSITSLSLRPLLSLFWIGLIVTLSAIVIGLFMLVNSLVLGDPLGLHITGSGFLGVFITFLVGIVLTTQGILAMYVSHIHQQSQHRPLFVIDGSRSVNLPDPR